MSLFGGKQYIQGGGATESKLSWIIKSEKEGEENMRKLERGGIVYLNSWEAQAREGLENEKRYMEKERPAVNSILILQFRVVPFPFFSLELQLYVTESES